jgi:DNA-binding NtrC family response regulator
MEKILIVDDDIILCKILSEELSTVGYETTFVHNGDDAFNILKDYPADLLLLDLKMPGKDGFQVLKELRENGIKSKVIVLTAYADVKSAIEATKLGASDFISKPYDFDELIITIRKVLQSDS